MATSDSQEHGVGEATVEQQLEMPRQAVPAPAGSEIVDGRFRVSFILSLVALAISAAVGFLSLYLPYRVDHGLEVTIGDFNPDASSGFLGVSLIFSNHGNQYETVMSAAFVLTSGTAMEATFWGGGLRVVLVPVVLSPGETAFRYLEQPMDHSALIQTQKNNANSFAFDDPDHQRIVLEVVVRDVSGLPRTHRILVAAAGTRGDRAGPWEVYGNVPTSSELPGSLIRVDLHQGGKIGFPFRKFDSVRYSKGEFVESVVPWPRPAAQDTATELPN